MPDITLYSQPGFHVQGHSPCFSGTPFAIKVQRVLQYKKLAFRVHQVEWLTRQQELPSLSKSGKLPVLDYDGERVEDSSRIAHLIEQRHPTPTLWPNDPVERARCHIMEDWADETLYWYGVYAVRLDPPGLVADAYFAGLPAAFVEKASDALTRMVDKNLHRQGFGRYSVEEMTQDMRRSFDSIAALVDKQGFLATEHITLADIAAFAQFHRRLAGTNPWFEGEVRARPAIGEWLQRVDSLTQA